VLKDHKYSFEYRKKHALYLKKFAFYDQALEALNSILADEIKYYQVQLKEEVKEG
jgi:hypothetical protein